MKHGGKMLACIIGGLAAGSLAKGVPVDPSENSENPYQSIIDRNVFSLKPAPLPTDPAEANKPQVLKITLTGITTIFGDKRVLMKTAPPPGKPGEGPKTEQSYILTEGQREGDIEVIHIDDRTGSVKVNNAGTVQTLTFEKDGAKLPATAAPGAPGVGAPHIPGLPITRPGTLPATPPGIPNFQLPTRVPRLPMPAGSQVPGVSPTGVSGSEVSNPGYTSTPNYTTPGVLPGNTTSLGLASRLGTAPQPNTQTLLPGGQLSAEEQAILIEANRQAGGVGSSMLPPTMLTPKAPGTETVAPGQSSVPQLPTPGRPMPPGPF